MASPCGGQDAPDSNDQRIELAELKGGFEGDLISAFIPQLERYLEELDKLELTLAQSGDYAGATRVKEERTRVGRSLDWAESQLTERAEEDSTPLVVDASKHLLLPEDATLAGGARYDAETESVAGLVEEGATITWELPELEPGGYEVRLRYQPATNGGGTIQVAEEFFRLVAVIPAASDDHLPEIMMGTLRIREGSGPLTLEVLAVTNRNLMTLQGIELTPAHLPSP